MYHFLGVAKLPAAGSIVLLLGSLNIGQLLRRYTSAAAKNQLPCIRMRETTIYVRGRVNPIVIVRPERHHRESNRRPSGL
jgi:hypothetical protein